MYKTFTLCLLVFFFCSVFSAPRHTNLNQVHGNPEVNSLTALKPRSKKWHLEPVSVTKIDKKDEETGAGSNFPHTFSQVKESHSVFSDVGGRRNEMKQEHEQVNKNGKLVSNILHKQTSNKAENEEKPHFEDITEVDIPELDLHEKIVNNDGVETKVHTKRAKPAAGVRPPFSAADLAEYVLETGDQASVVQLLEQMIMEGELSEEQALNYVESIKAYLDEAEKNSEESVDEEEKIREILLERKLEESMLKQKMREEEEAREEFMNDLVNEKLAENESVLKINNFLESSLREGKISSRLYNRIKSGLIESVVAGLEPQQRDDPGLDYSTY